MTVVFSVIQMNDKYKIQQSMSTENESASKRYMQLVLGQDSIIKLLLYELVTMVSTRRSGALGLFLRNKMYPWLLRSCGRNVIFGHNVNLRHPHKITIGDGVVVDDNVLLDAKGETNDGIALGDGVFIGRNSILSCKNGDISLGRNTNIGFNCILATTNSIRLGEDNIVAAYTYFVGGGNYQYDHIDRPMREMYDYEGKGGVETKNNVWVAAHCTLLDGVVIGEGCVIAAGSVVAKSLPPDTIAMGIPAKAVRKRK
jgi:acetyltransferase-like isoleucine patch superfamily enzyme